MKLKQLLVPFMATTVCFAADAANVKVSMNAVSTTMSLASKDSGKAVETGEPVNKVYDFEIPSGEYVLTAFGTDGETVNGTIVLNVTDDSEQEFKLITNTAYVSNKNEDGSVWTVADGDYTLDVTVNTREGERQTITVGNSTTAGRNTFLAFNGNSYTVSFIPSAAHQAEGYTTLYRAGTLTANVNVNGAIPKAGEYMVTVPADAELSLGLKFTHFTNFTVIEPKSVETKGGSKVYSYSLADGMTYNFRTWKKDGLTQGGYFTMSLDETTRPALNFTDADYKAFDPKQINHDVSSNQGYETGDIFVNINERGHLDMKVGDTFFAHAMRTWELTDNSTNNYFIEPDFHYTVIGLDGKPSEGVIEIGNADTSISPWTEIKAVGNGTAIVLVTYDGIGLNYYKNDVKTPYLGGEFWGAIWPENTGVYVVTVGDGVASVNPNMTINEDYNQETLKLAGKYVDAEHDVFYYLDSDPGAYYTFTPDGASNVTIAYPVIGERMTTYNGFTADGVTNNEDGSYTLLLKEGRQIVRMTDASGNSAYQVLTAKTCHRDITNVSRPGSNIFQPGDQIKIQYSGLRHPANKLAGIYNMSAYVTYNGIPNGSSLILGSGQYTFGSVPSAQAVTVSIPEDLDVDANPEMVMDNGVIQVNGYGDPIGNHRTISHIAGRSPNFTAIAHKTYFGAIPEVRIALSPVKNFDIQIKSNVSDAKIELYFKGEVVNPDDSGNYTGTYGTYNIVATKAGYRCFRGDYTIADDASGLQIFDVEMDAAPNAWDGVTKTEPDLLNSVYQISSGAELAWFAKHVNEGGEITDAVVTKDIDLGNYDWTPIGANSKPTGGAFSGNQYEGNFDGQMHTISGLYINQPTYSYQALFGYVKSCTISNVEVSGSVSGKQNVGGLVGSMTQDAVIDRCVNNANVTSVTVWCSGIVGNMANAATKVTNCYNTGNITGTTSCGGVVGMNNKESIIENVYNLGVVTGTTVGACVGGTPTKEYVRNAFSIYEYGVTESQTLVTEEQMRSGEVAYLLGDAFGQEIGVDEYPVLGGKKVLYDAEANRYYNDSTSGLDKIVVPDTDAEVIYYNLQGVASKNPFKGFNVVRMSDGSVRKIFVK